MAITPGDSLELIWEVGADVNELSIDNGIGSVLSSTVDGLGSLIVEPGPLVSSSYEMTATGLNGSSSVATSVLVVDEPLIYSFSGDALFVSPNTSVELTWNVGGMRKC